MDRAEFSGCRTGYQDITQYIADRNAPGARIAAGVVAGDTPGANLSGNAGRGRNATSLVWQSSDAAHRCR